jgi:hypothetical protein
VAACGCAAVFGAGVPLAWIWVASQLTASPGQSISGLAALASIFGPPATYFAVLILAGVLGASKDSAARPPRMSWNYPAGEVRPRNRPIGVFEAVLLLGTVIVLIGFEVWFLGFARAQPWAA